MRLTPISACSTDAPARRASREQLASVGTKIAQLQALREELARMVAAGCNGAAAECRVIEVLADHSLCAQDHSQPDRLPTQRPGRQRWGAGPLGLKGPVFYGEEVALSADAPDGAV